MCVELCVFGLVGGVGRVADFFDLGKFQDEKINRRFRERVFLDFALLEGGGPKIPKNNRFCPQWCKKVSCAGHGGSDVLASWCAVVVWCVAQECVSMGVHFWGLWEGSEG